MFEASYIGSKGTHLGVFRRFNIPLAASARRPAKPAAVPGARHAFPAPAHRQLVLSIASIKSGKAPQKLPHLPRKLCMVQIDRRCGRISVGQFESAGAQNESNLRLERGLSFSNVPRRISAGFVYNLPKMLRSWQLSGLITLQDGTPVNPFYFATDLANSGTPNRPNVVPGQRSAYHRASEASIAGSIPRHSAIPRPTPSATQAAILFQALEMRSSTLHCIAVSRFESAPLWRSERRASTS